METLIPTRLVQLTRIQPFLNKIYVTSRVRWRWEGSINHVCKVILAKKTYSIIERPHFLVRSLIFMRLLRTKLFLVAVFPIRIFWKRKFRQLWVFSKDSYRLAVLAVVFHKHDKSAYQPIDISKFCTERRKRMTMINRSS